MDPSHGATCDGTFIGGINVDSNRLEYKLCSY